MKLLIYVACMVVSLFGCSSASQKSASGENLGKALGTSQPSADKQIWIAFDDEWAKPGLGLYKTSATFPDMKLFPGQKFESKNWDTLRVSVSAQPSESALLQLLQRTLVPITIIDVRQESHGFINGGPITWVTEHNWGNLGRSHDSALAEEDDLINGLKKTGFITKEMFKTAAPGQRAPKRATIEKLKISSAESEQFLVEGQNARYVRMTVTDGLRPSDEDVDRLIEAIRILPEKGWFHVHDRMEGSRANLVSAMIDMLKNANVLSFDAIVKRQNAFLVDEKWSDPTKAPEAIQLYARESRAFLEAFYKYAAANPLGQPKTWTER